MAVEGYSNADWIAQGNTLEAQYSPTQLFTAEDEIKTAAAEYASGNNVAVLTIVAKNAAGRLVPWNPAATVAVTGGATSQTAPAPESIPVGIAAADMNTGNTNGGYNANVFGPYYCGGCFNPDLLVWPASLTTYAARVAALEARGAPFRVKRLL